MTKEPDEIRDILRGGAKSAIQTMQETMEGFAKSKLAKMNELNQQVTAHQARVEGTRTKTEAISGDVTHFADAVPPSVQAKKAEAGEVAKPDIPPLPTLGG